MKFISLICVLIYLGPLQAETLSELLACHQTLTAPVEDQYSTQGGYLMCDGPGKACFLSQGDGSVFRSALSEHPTFTVREVNFDMTDSRQVIQHRLVTFAEPKTKKKAFVDVFWGENNRAFARNLMQANLRRLDMLTFKKASAGDLEPLVKQRIADQFKNLKVMIEKREGQPGVGLENSKKDWIKRMSRCDWSEVAQKLRKDVEQIK